MNWLARLKGQKGPDTQPTETTKMVSVVSVGTQDGHIQKFNGRATPANDSPAAPDGAYVLAVPDLWNVHIPPGTSLEIISKFRAASLALDASQRAAGISPELEPDTHCWPHSSAMNGGEIGIFMARLARFTDKGLNLDAAERLADKLVIRDREDDDRRVCLECTHLHRADGWRCGNWQAAGVACRPRDAHLPADLTIQLQRCDGFTAHATSRPRGTVNETDRV
jgi:hypothetical protein